MSIPDANITGNFGLKDQQMAMRWVRDNIRWFGGNPNRITLVGWSAGSASVTYHLYANTSAGLFHRAILMSGNMLDPWAFNSAPHECSKTMSFWKHANLTGNTRRLVDAKRRLQKLKASQFLTKFSKQFAVVYFGIPEYCFVPTYDNDFANVRPSDMIKSSPPTSRVPLLIGSTANEANFNFPYEFEMRNVRFPNANTTIPTLINDYMRHLLKSPSLFPFKFRKRKREFIQQLQGMTDINYGINKFLNAYTSHTVERVFLYRFSFDGKFGQEHNERITSVAAGAAVHGDELGYLVKDRIALLLLADKMENDEAATATTTTTGKPTMLLPPLASSSAVYYGNASTHNRDVEFKDEILTRKRMVEMWTNFIKFG